VVFDDRKRFYHTTAAVANILSFPFGFLVFTAPHLFTTSHFTVTNVSFSTPKMNLGASLTLVTCRVGHWHSLQTYLLLTKYTSTFMIIAR
jgi:hypothetical protein